MADTIRIDPARKARGATTRPHCDHTTCPGCSTCPCHQKPKAAPVEPATAAEASIEGARLRTSALRVIRFLDAMTSTDKKTRPKSLLEQAILRGHADLDAAVRSPALNGAVSGGDDPSWRILDSITEREIIDADGNYVSGGNLADRFDATTAALTALTNALEELERLAATASTAIDTLRAIPANEAKRLLEAESDVQHCVNCGKVVTGAADDRLRAGRCSTCNQYKREHHGRDRPKSLIDKELEREMAAASTIPATAAGKFSSQSPEVG